MNTKFRPKPLAMNARLRRARWSLTGETNVRKELRQVESSMKIPKRRKVK